MRSLVIVLCVVYCAHAQVRCLFHRVSHALQLAYLNCVTSLSLIGTLSHTYPYWPVNMCLCCCFTDWSCKLLYYYANAFFAICRKKGGPTIEMTLAMAIWSKRCRASRTEVKSQIFRQNVWGAHFLGAQDGKQNMSHWTVSRWVIPLVVELMSRPGLTYSGEWPLALITR